MLLKRNCIFSIYLKFTCDLFCLPVQINVYINGLSEWIVSIGMSKFAQLVQSWQLKPKVLDSSPSFGTFSSVGKLQLEGTFVQNCRRKRTSLIFEKIYNDAGKLSDVQFVK